MAKIQIGFLQLPPVVIGMLVLILGVQALLARSSRLRLRPHELFTVYVMMLMALMVSAARPAGEIDPAARGSELRRHAGEPLGAPLLPSIPHWAVPWSLQTAS